jgi:hypothetical protein
MFEAGALSSLFPNLRKRDRFQFGKAADNQISDLLNPAKDIDVLNLRNTWNRFILE